MNHKRLLRRMILLILSAVFLFSAAMVLRYAVQSRTEQKAFERLAAMVEQDVPEKASASAESAASEETAFISPYLPLKKQNEDFFGWISIEGTNIDYPVMYTPDDPEYYLRRAFDKSSSRSGVPFLDAACFPGCGNYLIYGHNMDSGTMFADLLSYADREFWQEHPLIQFDTLDQAGSYAVLSAFYTEISPDTEFRYDRYTDLRNWEDFLTYMGQVQASALYDTGITAEYGDQLLTLSTCSYHKENGRFVVVACKTASTSSPNPE